MLPLPFFSIFHWKDIIELSILFCAVYGISLWLKKDKTKPLLSALYGYWLLWMICNFIELSTIYILLMACLPFFALFLFFIHQNSLQQRWIMYRSRINCAQLSEKDWLEIIIRSGLIALNQKKDWFIIIEHQYDLSSLLEAKLPIEVNINESLFSLILNSSLYDCDSLIWIKSNAQLKGVNVAWRMPEQLLQDQAIKDLPLWKQDALLMTLKTDAIICKALPEWRAFDVIIAGKIFEQVNAHQMFTLLKKQLNYQSQSESGDVYVSPNVNADYQERAH